MVFSTVTELAIITPINFRTFSLPQKKLGTHQQSFPILHQFPPIQPQAATHPLSISIDTLIPTLTVSGITLYVVSRDLASFTQLRVLTVHPCYTMQKYLMPLYGLLECWNIIYSIAWIHHIFFIQTSDDGHLCCFIFWLS